MYDIERYLFQNVHFLRVTKMPNLLTVEIKYPNFIGE
jgi:hypothetical protein